MKEGVRSAIRFYPECLSIDLALVRQEKEKLKTTNVWQWLGMDITTIGDAHYLTLIDCRPTPFAIWWPGQRGYSANDIRCLDSVFLERGLLEEILTWHSVAEILEYLLKAGMCAYISDTHIHSLETVLLNNPIDP